MRKAVSFCLYGTSNLYLDKFFLNIPIYKKYFFDYDIILHADIRLKNQLLSFCITNKIKLFFEIQKSHSDGMFWRFKPIFDKKYDLLLIRDVDYTPSEYELDLVNEFIGSSYSFHIVRSHFDHKMPIMGGLFGIKKDIYDDFELGYQKWKKKHYNFEIIYNDDQLFLANYIYDKVYLKSIIHTSNVIFLGERYKIINPPVNFIIGGDDRHKIDYKNRNYIYFFLPVCIQRIIHFKAMNYLKIRFKKK